MAFNSLTDTWSVSKGLTRITTGKMLNMDPKDDVILPHQFGKKTLVWGPMVAGKTEDCHRRVKIRHIAAQYDPRGINSICIINHADDKRNGLTAEHVSTHDGTSMLGIATYDLFDPTVKQAVDQAQHVFVNEGQFFPELADFVRCVSSLGKNITVFGLSTWFDGSPCPATAECATICNEIVILYSVCRLCGQDAGMTGRIGKSRDIKLIGGKDKYIPLCSKCHFLHMGAKLSTPENIWTHFQLARALRQHLQVSNKEEKQVVHDGEE